MTSVRVSTWTQADGSIQVCEKHTEGDRTVTLINTYPAGTNLDTKLASNGAMVAAQLAEEEASQMLGGG